MATKRKRKFLPKGNVTVDQVLGQDNYRNILAEVVEDIPTMAKLVIIWAKTDGALSWRTSGVASIAVLIGLLEQVKFEELLELSGREEDEDGN